VLAQEFNLVHQTLAFLMHEREGSWHGTIDRGALPNADYIVSYRL